VVNPKLVGWIWDSDPLFKAKKVLNLKKFTYDKASRKIMEEQVKKVPTMRGDLILVVTQTPVSRRPHFHILYPLHLHDRHKRRCLKFVPTKSREGSKD